MGPQVRGSHPPLVTGSPPPSPSSKPHRRLLFVLCSFDQPCRFAFFNKITCRHTRARPARRRYFAAVFTACPPNSCLIIASNLFANGSGSCDLNRVSSAPVITGSGTPNSIPSTAVHRPSPESVTYASIPSKVGFFCSASTVKSSSHDRITLPNCQICDTCNKSKLNSFLCRNKSSPSAYACIIPYSIPL